MQQSSMQQSTFICSKELLCQTQHESDCFSTVLSFAAGLFVPLQNFGHDTAYLSLLLLLFLCAYSTNFVRETINK